MKPTFIQIFKRPKLALTFLCLPLLAACGDDEAEIMAAQDAALVGNKIECALNGADEFSKICATERVSAEDGTILMIRHSDGGFKRFRILTDGRGLEAAEGFNDSHIEIIDENHIILSSGNDRYKLKAQLKGGLSQSDAAPLEENLITEVAQAITPENDGEVQNDIADSEVGPIGTPGAPYQAPQ